MNTTTKRLRIVQSSFGFAIAAAISSAPAIIATERTADLPAWAKAGTTDTFAKLRTKAESGDAEAQMSLGRMYYTGDTVPKNNVEALNWLRKAGDQNHTAAQCMLGLLYETDDDFKKDKTEAFKWLLKAAERGISSAQFFVASKYCAGDGIPRNVIEGIAWANIAVDSGNNEIARVSALWKAAAGHDTTSAAFWRSEELRATIKAAKSASSPTNKSSRVDNLPGFRDILWQSKNSEYPDIYGTYNGYLLDAHRHGDKDEWFGLPLVAVGRPPAREAIGYSFDREFGFSRISAFISPSATNDQIESAINQAATTLGETPERQNSDIGLTIKWTGIAVVVEVWITSTPSDLTRGTIQVTHLPTAAKIKARDEKRHTSGF